MSNRVTQKQRSSANGPVLQRCTLTTSRMMEFCSKKELVNQTGHAVRDWPLVIFKELVDNALDACEEAGIAPEIKVEVNEHGITVADDGPGIPAETVAGALNFSVRVSSREAYVSPTRGAQGNALKTIVAMPFVLSGDVGHVTIDACGVRHAITMKADAIRQVPVIEHQKTAGLVKTGTRVTVQWPDSSSSIPDDKTVETLQNDVSDDLDGDDDLEEFADDSDDSPSSILVAAKGRFLQIAEAYSFLNPHLSLAVDWFGEVSSYAATNPNWKKWRPSDPTCAHWYQEDQFNRLIAGYIAHDQDHERDRTVREFVAEFRGLSGTAKQKAVLEETDLARAKLSDLATIDGMRRDITSKLLESMKGHSKPVPPTALGLISREHLKRRLVECGVNAATFEYRKSAGVRDGVPWVVESAFGVDESALVEFGGEDRRKLIVGVNFAPAIGNPFRHLGEYGESLDGILEEQRAGPDEPVVFAIHLTSPRIQYTDRGKTAIAIME